jgi:hypothetical protein
MARALSEVSKHYKIPHVSADKIALGTLVWTMGRIYVPKVYAIKARKSGHGVQANAPPGATAVEPSVVEVQPDASEWFGMSGNA